MPNRKIIAITPPSPHIKWGEKGPLNTKGILQAFKDRLLEQLSDEVIEKLNQTFFMQNLNRFISQDPSDKFWINKINRLFCLFTKNHDKRIFLTAFRAAVTSVEPTLFTHLLHWSTLSTSGEPGELDTVLSERSRIYHLWCGDGQDIAMALGHLDISPELIFLVDPLLKQEHVSRIADAVTEKTEVYGFEGDGSPPPTFR